MFEEIEIMTLSKTEIKYVNGSIEWFLFSDLILDNCTNIRTLNVVVYKSC